MPDTKEGLEAIVEAVSGIADDYMTSETHHPGYVLIPVAKFEQLRRADALSRAIQQGGGDA
jgi:PHD/YefM family antitoxin component YafN of YafNO toxin-antitoxin module